MENKGVALPERPKRYSFRAVYHLGSHHPMDGKPVMGGRVLVFQVGTNNRVETYSDPELTIPCSIPTFLNSEGEADIYVQPGQRIRVLILDMREQPVEEYEIDV